MSNLKLNLGKMDPKLKMVLLEIIKNQYLYYLLINSFKLCSYLLSVFIKFNINSIDKPYKVYFFKICNKSLRYYILEFSLFK